MRYEPKLSDVQFVVTVLDCSQEGPYAHHFAVKVGMHQVGRVYRIDEDAEEEPEHRGRWVWEKDDAPSGEGCSLDVEGRKSYRNRSTAVWALLEQFDDAQDYCGTLRRPL